MAAPFGPATTFPLITNSTTSGTLTLLSTRADAFVKTDTGVWVFGANVEIIPAVGAAYRKTFEASATDMVGACIALANAISAWF